MSEVPVVVLERQPLHDPVTDFASDSLHPFSGIHPSYVLLRCVTTTPFAVGIGEGDTAWTGFRRGARGLRRL